MDRRRNKPITLGVLRVWHRPSPGERAQGLVELALVLPLLTVLVCAIIDFGWALRSHVILINAAREGARYGVTCKTDSQIATRAQDHSSGLLTASDVEVLSNPCTAGRYSASSPYEDGGAPVKVRAAHDHNYITPLGGLVSMISGGTLPDPLPLSTTTTMRSE